MNERHQRVDWPGGYERTDPDDREAYPGSISLDHREAFKSITEELDAWGAVLDRVEFEPSGYQRNPNIPHKSADPDDPGVAVYFRRLDEDADAGYAIACDRWDSLRDNARAISLYVRRMRLAERCGVETAQSTMETARLPPADEDAVAAGGFVPYEVLDVSPDAGDAIVKGAARALMGRHHPDNGGDREQFKRVQKAKEAMLDE